MIIDIMINKENSPIFSKVKIRESPISKIVFINLPPKELNNLNINYNVKEIVIKSSSKEQ
jgi:hypothetical protein